MQSVATTVVALVGAPSALLDRMGAATNVRCFRAVRDAPALDRAAEAWGAARLTRSPYFVHDADPLAWIVDAWSTRFDGQGAAGELEVAVSQTISRWRAGSIELPDYYVLVSPDGWGRTRRHWYLGVLASTSASRVIVADGRGDPALLLPGLPIGRWWPPLDSMVEGVDRVVPDRAGVDDGTAGPADGALFVGTDG
jgi:hypothetical protein